MLTQSDFQTAIANSMGGYPAVAPLYVAQDPRIMASLDAMAMMLAMFSAQVEVAASEASLMARDSTVLANAALRGIINKGASAAITVQAQNNTGAPITVTTGDALTDTVGNDYVATTGVTVPAATTAGMTMTAGSATFNAVQKKTVAIAHTVTASVAFYKIEIPAQDGLFIASIAVSDSGNGAYQYRNNYVNTLPDEFAYQVEVDEKQRIYVVLGMAGIAGVQLPTGHVLAITAVYCAGVITAKLNSPMTFNAASDLGLYLNAIVYAGASPLPISALRDLCKYPAIYDNSAVFMGEFGYLVNRNFPALRFVSVWNESVEEAIRGINVDNVNALFVAVYQSGEAVLTETDPLTPVPPTFIADADLTPVQSAIKAALNQSDSSYRVKFMTPVVAPITLAITATVSASYVIADVENRITAALMAEYGVLSGNAKRKIPPTQRGIQILLVAAIPELADSQSELSVFIPAYPNSARPELYRYVTTDSLAVTVSSANLSVPIWG